jgi:hypothetical protein
MGGAEGVSPVTIGAAGMVLATGGFILLFLWAVRASRQDHAERARVASAKGWRYESDSPGMFLYRVAGSTTSGVPWQLVADSGGSDDSGSTVWSTDAICLPDLEMMIRARGPYEHTKGAGGQAGLNLTGTIATMAGMPRPQLLDLARTGIEHRPERTAVRENFTILTCDPFLARAVITSEVEEALARWAMCPYIGEQQRRSLVVDLGQTNLRAHCTGVLANGETMSLLIELGTALARAYRQVESPNSISLAAF